MDLIEAVKAAGIAGAGGAGFPTHIKLSAKADCFIVNAAECEPLIETDKYLARTFPDKLVAATDLVAGHVGASRRVIALKSKYVQEIAALKDAIGRAGSSIELFEMPAFYPAGDEQTLVSLICGVTVPERGIPLDVGAVVDNVGTLLNVYDAMQGIPVTEKYLSVVGEVEKPVMLRVPVGTMLTECIDAAEPRLPDYAVILGGPMMGKPYAGRKAVEGLSVTKTTGNILLLPKDHYLIRHAAKSVDAMRAQTRSACIQCRMCTDLCPRYLIGHRMRPHLVMRNLFREHLIADNAEYERTFGEAANCCDCGACEMFSCPMGLSPCRVNGYIKGRLRERGIQVERNLHPVAREGASGRRIPTDRLAARLGLMDYYPLHARECLTLNPSEVHIPFRQHIGKPAVPVRQAGETVNRGELLAKAADGALSINIHASISGVIVKLDETGAVISRSEED